MGQGKHLIFESLCISCRYGEEKVMIQQKAPWATAQFTKPVSKLTYYCNFLLCFKLKTVKNCYNYKPKSGKIGKKCYQKELF